MEFDEAVSLIKKELLLHLRIGSVVSASNIYERIRIEQPEDGGKLSVWTEYCPEFYRALLVTGPMSLETESP